MSQDMMSEEEHIAAQRALDEARLVTSVLRRPIRTLQPLTDAITCDQTITVRQAIETMQQRHIGCLLVVHQGRLVGVFTERDVLNKVSARDIDIDRTPVEDLMTPEPECLGPDDELVYAINQMHVGGYRHIPLVDDAGHPIGDVSMRDMMAAVVELFPQEILNLPPSPSHDISNEREGA
jgi:CBS domain-containing protein